MKQNSMLKIAICAVFSCVTIVNYGKGPKITDPRDDLYGKTANGDCGSGVDAQGITVGYAGKGYKKDGFVIKFRSKLNILGNNTWSLLNGTGTDAYTITSGKVDVSVAVDKTNLAEGYVLTLDLKSPKSSATVARLIKPNYSTNDFYSGLFFVRPQLKQAFYQDIAKYTRKSGGTVIRDLFENLFQQLGSTNTGRIENVDNSVFKDIGSLGYIYVQLSK